VSPGKGACRKAVMEGRAGIEKGEAILGVFARLLFLGWSDTVL
jgi:hypothetical protein